MQPHTKPDELASKYSCRSPACFFLEPTRSAGISRRCRRNRILYGSHKQFLSILHQLYFMSFFATYVWLTVSKHQHRKPAALRAVYALSVIGILLLIITQFTGLFYYFDDHNLYHRGNFYLLSQAIAVLGIALCLFMLISYRKNLDRIIFLSMMSFFVLPVLATIYQHWHTVFHCNVWRS